MFYLNVRDDSDNGGWLRPICVRGVSRDITDTSREIYNSDVILFQIYLHICAPIIISI